MRRYILIGGCLGILCCSGLSGLLCQRGHAKVDDKTLGPLIFTALQRHHVTQPTFDAGFNVKAMQHLWNRLDPGKHYFQGADIASFSSHAPRWVTALSKGDFSLAQRIHDIRLARYSQCRDWMVALLDRPFDFTQAESYETNPHKRFWGKDATAQREHWRLFLKWQCLQQVLLLWQESPQSEFGDLEVKARNLVKNKMKLMFDRLQATELEDTKVEVINAVASTLDPHTKYYPPNDREFENRLNGKISGVGLKVERDGSYIRVSEVIPGGVADRVGSIEPGDQIIRVANADNGEGEAVEVSDMPLSWVVQQVRGEKGTKVTLTIRKDDGRLLIVPLIRDWIQSHASKASGRIMYNKTKNIKLAYLKLPSFYREVKRRGTEVLKFTSSNDVALYLKEFNRSKVEGLVLDLRSNPGGSLADAKLIAGLFLTTGPVVQVKAGHNRKEVLYDAHMKAMFTKPMVILVNRYSASAAEIVAGTLQDYNRAVIVGPERTFGKGTVQSLVNLDAMRKPHPQGKDLPPAGRMKITTKGYYRVTGLSTQGFGVKPDIVLPDPTGFRQVGDRYLPHAISFAPVKSEAFGALPAPKLPDLARLSNSRVERSNTLRGISRVVEVLRKHHQVTRVNLSVDEAFSARRELRNQAGDVLESARPQKDEQGQKMDPFLEESLSVLLDLIAQRDGNGTD